MNRIMVSFSSKAKGKLLKSKEKLLKAEATVIIKTQKQRKISES